MIDNKISICHISESTSGGVYTHLCQLAKYLDPEKFEQTFILSSIKGPKLRQLTDFCGKRLHIIDMCRHINPLTDFKSLIRIYKLLKTSRFDIIHCHSSKAGVIGRIAAIMTGHRVVFYTPHAFSFHAYNTGLNNFVFKFIERLMGFITTKLICVSEGEYNQALSANIIKRKKLVVIPNGINEDGLLESGKSKQIWLREHGFSGEEQVVGFVGRLSLQKNLEMLIQASKGIPNSNVVFVIIGDGDLRGSCERLVSDLCLKDRFLFIGEVENATEFLFYFDIFVSTSLWEGLPYAILEAIALNVPVIATNIPGVKEIIRHNETGILVTPGDEVGLRKNIVDLLTHHERGRKLALSAKNMFNKRYTLQCMISRISSLYLAQKDK